ncbi:integrase catalytic domain-containing protein [Trichonephila clavipes]|nr:integrase catalytic domain-containing protein [Trichonephila clavipes]
MLKTILRKVLHRAYLNEKEMTIVLCDAESVLNSRPLTYISEEPDELIALSPSAFLQEIREVEVPDLDYFDSKKLNKRFIYKQKMLQHLKLRFRNEYLGQLKDFSKVRKALSIKEGDIVLVGDTNSKRINWSLGQKVGQPGNFPFPGEEPTPLVADGHSTREPPSVPYPVSTKTDQQDPLMNPIPNNVPSTSNISAFPSNSGVQPSSASTSIQDTKQKAKTRARKRKKELLKKINDVIIEIKMAPHKPRKSTPEQDSEDEDMIEYNPDEFDPDDYVQKYYNIGKYESVITPTCYKNLKK